MLITQTLDKLDALGMFGMAMGVREQLESTHYANLSFEERLGVLVDREAEVRDSRRLALRLRAAKLRQEATVEDIDFRAPRRIYLYGSPFVSAYPLFVKNLDSVKRALIPTSPLP